MFFSKYGIIATTDILTPFEFLCALTVSFPGICMTKHGCTTHISDFRKKLHMIGKQ